MSSIQSLSQTASLSWPGRPLPAKKTASACQSIKQGIWLYFFLLVFEGALRKWVLPSLSTPLLLVRDPLALWLLYKTWRVGLLKANIYLSGTVLIGTMSFFASLFFGHGNLPVALYGARILLFHFPLVFVIAHIFERKDVIKFGRVMVWLTIPMALLIAVQFYGPQSAWINRGVGGNMEGGGFSGALGYFRPPATFSFTNGTTLFFGLSSCFIFYFWFHPKLMNRMVLAAATAALMAAVPLSISRALFYSVGVSLLFTVAVSLVKPKYLGKIVFAAIGIGLLMVALSYTSFFQVSVAAFSSRFEGATEYEGGVGGSLINRFFGDFILSFTMFSNLPFFGNGLGAGTNVGRSVELVLDIEHEWARLIGEMGYLFGSAIIVIRLALCVKIAARSYTELRAGNLLPWMLLGFCLLNLPVAQWGQPTALGFSTLVAGLSFAALKKADAIRPVRRPAVLHPMQEPSEA